MKCQVGTVEFGKNRSSSSEAIELRSCSEGAGYRMVQANKACAKWKEIRRLPMDSSRITFEIVWLAQRWGFKRVDNHKVQRGKIASWCTHMVAIYASLKDFFLQEHDR